MPLNQLDIDDAMSAGVTKSDQWMQDIDAEFMKPYAQSKSSGLWYAYLEKSFPGIPGAMIEQKLQEADPKRYEATKKRFTDAIGGKNGTV